MLTLIANSRPNSSKKQKTLEEIMYPEPSFGQTKSEIASKDKDCTSFVFKFKNEICNVLASAIETPEILDADGVPVRNRPKPVPMTPQGVYEIFLNLRKSIL